MSIRFLLVALALAASPAAFSTPQLRNATDLWFDPAESGWGINFIHQGDTLFATLFVYGADGQPTWYVASSLVGGPELYAGALYEVTAPWFGGPFDAASAVRRQVGSMTLDLRDTVSTLTYSVDGVQVSKAVSRFSFGRSNLGGLYRGQLVQPASAPGAETRRDQEQIAIQDDGTNIHIDSSSDSAGICSFNGTRGQNGQIQLASGTSTCNGAAGQWSMRVDPTPAGFTGFFEGAGVSAPLGRIGGARAQAPATEGNGWRNDLWFRSDESGWGLNVIEQGDTIFATLFVNDSQRRPRWYTASQLTRAGSGVPSHFSGGLHESTGPWFGAPFNPGAVTRRQVGTMSFQVTDDGNGVVSYTVDGVSVTKTVTRFAFRKNDLSGSYVGYLAEIVGAGREAVRITIDDSGANFAMQTVALDGNTGTCTYSGTSNQLGSQRYAGGTYSCTGGFSGFFTLSRAAVSFNGFTAGFQGPRFTDMHIVGVRTN